MTDNMKTSKRYQCILRGGLLSNSDNDGRSQAMRNRSTAGRAPEAPAVHCGPDKPPSSARTDEQSNANKNCSLASEAPPGPVQRWRKARSRQTNEHIVGARLPPELYRIIICHAGLSAKLLCSLSLVSRMLRDEAQCLLFRRVELKGDCCKLLSWCTTVCNNQSLAGFVRELVLPSTCDTGSLLAREQLRILFPGALSSLTALQTLHIYSTAESLFGLRYLSASMFLGRPFRLHTLELEHDTLGFAAHSWLPFLREQSDIQHWSIRSLSYGHFYDSDIAIALGSTSNTLTRLRLKILESKRCEPTVLLADVALLKVIGREVPNLIFLDLETSIDYDKHHEEFRSLVDAFKHLPRLESLLLTVQRCELIGPDSYHDRVGAFKHLPGLESLGPDSHHDRDLTGHAAVMDDLERFAASETAASYIAAQCFRSSPSLKRVAVRSFVRSPEPIPCFVRIDGGMAWLEGFDNLTDRSWSEV